MSFSLIDAIERYKRDYYIPSPLYPIWEEEQSQQTGNSGQLHSDTQADPKEQIEEDKKND